MKTKFDCNTPNNSATEEDEDSLAQKILPADAKESSKLIPASNINENDVLCGRGEAARRNLGNRRFRELVLMNQEEYFTGNILTKGLIADKIVEIITNRIPSGRFLKALQDDKASNSPTIGKNVMWYEISNQAAKVKTSQALRERNPELCKATQDLRDTEEESRTLSFPQEGDSSVKNQGFQHVKISKFAPEVGSVQNCGTPTSMINDVDVLCGRGAITNYHVGNVRFRNLVKSYKPQYLAVPKMRKAAIAQEIVDTIRKTDPPGRFLQLSSDSGGWVEISNEKAREKTSQALREGTAEVKSLYSVMANMDAAGSAPWNKKVGRKGYLQPLSSISSMPSLYPHSSVSSISPVEPWTHHQHINNGYRERKEIHEETLPESLRLPTMSFTGENFNICVSQHCNTQDFSSSVPLYVPSKAPIRPHNIVVQVSETDVLFGRGAAVNFHVGNLRFRKLVNLHRSAYLNAPKIEKAAIAKLVVEKIWSLNPPGRFLCKDSAMQEGWVEVDEKRAREKASQALRENVFKDTKAKTQKISFEGNFKSQTNKDTFGSFSQFR